MASKERPKVSDIISLFRIANPLFGLGMVNSRVTRLHGLPQGRSSARWPPHLIKPHPEQSLIGTTDLAIEFKEIRKEWKARKKEEDTQRKQEEERSRAQAAATQVDGQPDQPPPGQGPTYQPGSRPQLPPIGYQSAQGGEVPSPYPGPPAGMVYQQGNGQMGQYGQYPPHSPYGQQGQVYQQRKSPSHSLIKVNANADLSHSQIMPTTRINDFRLQHPVIIALPTLKHKRYPGGSGGSNQNAQRA